MKNVIKLISTMAFVVCSTNVYAGLITTPMTADSNGFATSDHVVGTIDIGTIITGGAGAEMIAAQALLNLGLGGTTTIDTNVYEANSAIDFSGTLLNAFKPADSFFNAIDTATLTITGYEYAMAKYDGPNAGYILFDLSDASSHVLPQYPSNFWTTTDSYELSHWVAFNKVPEPGVVFLFGIGLIGLAAVSRKKTV